MVRGPSNTLVAFGGQWNSDSTVWSWSASTGWTNAYPSPSPSLRGHSGFTFDPIRNRSVVFGGSDSNTRANLNDTWEWDGNEWTLISQYGPSSRKGHSLTWGPDSERVLLYGASNLGTEDLWEWSGTAWQSRTVFNPQAERMASAQAYDNARHDLIVFGGKNNYTWPSVMSTTQLVRYRANAAPEACTSAVIDFDNDGKKGCADDDCWAVCDPLQPSAASAAAANPATTRPPGAAYCGDGTCNGLETCALCPSDCSSSCPATTCGDFRCGGTETATSCPNDCVTCGPSSCSF
jgi:hypothetical protein